MKKNALLIVSMLVITAIIISVSFRMKGNIRYDVPLGDTKSIEVGDINADSKVNSMDYILLRKHILGSSKLTGDNLSRADTNSDGKVNSLDYIVIRKIIMGLYSSSSGNSKTLTATFTVQDPASVKTSKTVVSCTTSSSSCEITAPILTALKTNTTIIGWSTDSNNRKENVKSGEKITINKDTTFYSITSNIINITYNVGENISGINTKADSLSFYNNEHTRCTSYNGNGCNIKWIPTVIAPGKVVHGFSKTKDGEVINVAKTNFTEDTTLYARIYDCTSDSCRPKSFTAGRHSVIGNVLVVTEKGLDSAITNKFFNFVEALYREFPCMLMWNGAITLLTENTYASMYGKGTGGMTSHSGAFGKDFSNVSLYYKNTTYKNEHVLGAAMHEITHAYNRALYYNGGLSSLISQTSDVVNIYNKYNGMSSKPLSDTSYGNSSEFYSDLMEEYFRTHNDSFYLTAAPNGLTDDLIGIAEKYIKIGNNYYRSIGRL